MDDYDDGDYLDMDADWIYVEDEFDLADELAENAIPEPGYMGTAAEIAMESYDFDFYGYNEDLEYGEDPYWDTPGPSPTRKASQQQQISQEGEKTGSKRKRTAATRTSSSKKQKLAPAVERDAQPVLFRSRTTQRKLPVVTQKNLKPFALLPDWKERYKHEDGVVKNNSMPAAMAKAADEDAGQASHTDEEQKDNEDAEDAGAEAEEAQWQDQDDQDEAAEDDEGDEDDGDSSETGLDIDANQLQAIIAAKLAEAGISGDEEGAFLQSINDMLSGDGKGEAATALLEKAAQQQQVSSNNSSSTTTATSSTSRKRKAPDPAIGMEVEEGQKQTNKRGRKRKGGQAEN
ncbi:hypothetical protein Slin15195_G053100 [Septoria linicola]|uniref:Uncharacterized protein n=1 Tax=Septoria linicola TaxID=215465 RepID=A0A9Q9EHN2_9PEZI|nr:hypothetical protein Slin15195_G053100 [Septoria linicola]